MLRNPYVMSTLYFWADATRWVIGGAMAALYFNYTTGTERPYSVAFGVLIIIVLTALFALLSAVQAGVGGDPFED